jgi:hypothetical protein
VTFAVEACTGWRYVTGELRRAGIEAHLAGPADTAAARGRKSGPAPARPTAGLMRDLMAGGRLPECWIPPPQILEYRALPETYHALRREHTAWAFSGGPDQDELDVVTVPAGQRLIKIG